MKAFNRFFAAIDVLSEAHHMRDLFDMTDSELKVRGLDRDALTRGYISGLSAR